MTRRSYGYIPARAYVPDKRTDSRQLYGNTRDQFYQLASIRGVLQTRLITRPALALRYLVQVVYYGCNLPTPDNYRTRKISGQRQRKANHGQSQLTYSSFCVHKGASALIVTIYSITYALFHTSRRTIVTCNHNITGYNYRLYLCTDGGSQWMQT